MGHVKLLQELGADIFIQVQMKLKACQKCADPSELEYPYSFHVVRKSLERGDIVMMKTHKRSTSRTFRSTKRIF